MPDVRTGAKRQPGETGECKFGDRLDTGRNETMTYDALSRILTAQTAATSGQDCWGLSFGSSSFADDALGNLLTQTVSKCTAPSLGLSVNGNNQLNSPAGFSYDAAGDTTADGNYTYSYDAEGHITTSSAGVNYTYDGDGLRVEKSSGTLYWRSVTGQVIEETDASGTMQRDYAFFDGRRVAWRDSSGNVYYYFADVTGSTRAVTNATGTTCFNADYYPMGRKTITRLPARQRTNSRGTNSIRKPAIIMTMPATTIRVSAGS